MIGLRRINTFDLAKFDLNNKVVFITGSAVGIGKATAIELAKKGAIVILNGRNESKLLIAKEELLKQNVEVSFLVGDVSIFTDCERMMKQLISQFGRLDILINNAGSSAEGTIENSSTEAFRKVIEANLIGKFNATKAALPYIKQSKGQIVFNGSIAGFLGIPGFFAYSSSKRALESLSQSLRIEVINTGVHVAINFIGFTENDVNKKLIDANGNPQQIPKRKGFKLQTQLQVAKKIVSGIENKRRKQIFSTVGKFMSFMQRVFPRVFEQLLIIGHKRQLKKQKNVN